MTMRRAESGCCAIHSSRLASRPRDEREERVLVDDPRVERGRLDEQDEVLVAEAAEVASVRRRLRQELRREDICALGVEQLAQRPRQELVRSHVIEAPDDAVPIVPLEALRDEVQRDVRGVRPVEQAHGQSVVLADGQPVPRGVVRDRVGGRVLRNARLTWPSTLLPRSRG
jgi:hypothetical protein